MTIHYSNFEQALNDYHALVLTGAAVEISSDDLGFTVTIKA